MTAPAVLRRYPRVAFAAAAVPLLSLALATPEAVFNVFLTAFLAAAAFELMQAAAPQAGRTAAAAAGAAVALLVAAGRTVDAVHLWLLLPLLVVALVLALRTSREPARPAGAWWVLTVLYLGALGGHWLLLRDLDDGQRWLLVAFVATFATDSGAFAAGRLVGRHRMMPALSPGKTWEGAAGGFVAGAAASLLTMALLEPAGAGVAAAVVIAAALPVAAEAGDLLESAIKRRAGVKDMSRLLPGHGGLLDRMDSLLLTGPLLYWITRWLVT